MTINNQLLIAQKEIIKAGIKAAKDNDCFDYYQLHQSEIIKMAELLLKNNSTADPEVVIVACHLHDLSRYMAKNEEEQREANKNHHLRSAEIGAEIFSELDIPKEKVGLILECVKRHRNLPKFRPKTVNEKIVAVADSMSQFNSLFLFLYFKFKPNESLVSLCSDLEKKIEEAEKDIALLPGSIDIIKKNIEAFKRIINNFKNLESIKSEARKD